MTAQFSVGRQKETRGSPARSGRSVTANYTPGWVAPQTRAPFGSTLSARRANAARSARDTRRGDRSGVGRIVTLDVVLENSDELVDQALAAERPVELAVDEDRSDR